MNWMLAAAMPDVLYVFNIITQYPEETEANN